MFSQQSSLSSLSKLSYNSYKNGGSDENLPEDKDHRRQSVTAEDAQHFWSTLSIHAAAAVMDIGGRNKSALAAAESLLEHGEMQGMGAITPQTIRLAASKATIAILKSNSSESHIASAVAVAIIQTGTALLHEMNEQHLDQKETHFANKILAVRSSTHNNSSRTMSLRSTKSRNLSRVRKNDVMIHNLKQIRGSELQQNNPLDDNITIGSISTFGFKKWDKYATELDSVSDRGRNSVRNSSVSSNVLDKYATNSQLAERCSNEESSHASADPSQYSTDQSTIATMPYHGLGQCSSRSTKEDVIMPEYLRTTGGSSSSYNKTKKFDSLTELTADSSDINSIRRNEEVLGRQHAEFSAAVDALEKKVAAVVAALEVAGSLSASASMKRQYKLDKFDSTSTETPRMSNGVIDVDSVKKGKPRKRVTSAKATVLEAKENSNDDELTTSIGELSFAHMMGEASKLYRITEDTSETEHTKEDTAASNSDDRCTNLPSSIDFVWNKNPGGEEEEEPVEMVLAKNTVKDKMKGFLHHKKKKVNWAATNSMKIIPARSKRLSRAVLRRRRSSRRRSGKRRSDTTESSGGVINEQGPGHDVSARKAQTTPKGKESKVVTFVDTTLATEAEIPLNDTSSIFSCLSSPQSRQNDDALDTSQTSKKSASKNLPSPSKKFRQFFNQAFYSQPDHSIDDETVVTLCTNNSEAQSSVEVILEGNSFVDDKDEESRASHVSSYTMISSSTKGSKLGLLFA